MDGQLQHHGVKGMKWGVRKARNGVARAGKAIVKAKSKQYARNKAKLDAYHEKRKGQKLYQMDYKLYKSMAKGTKEQKHYKAVRATKKSRNNLKLNAAVFVGSASVTAYKLVGKRYVNKAIKKATSPEAVRMGKNFVNAIKRSPVRNVDGSKFKNVVNMANELIVR